MANLFNEDFTDFLRAFHQHKVEHLLVGGYAVILHGYTRSTADMDVWVNKTPDNYRRIVPAFAAFGAPVFLEKDFLSNEFDVWGIGREPNKIEILSEVKGLEFADCLAMCSTVKVAEFETPYIHIKHLIASKLAAGRYKDLADVEQLKKKLK